ncbi:hypothetical protein KZR06_12085 [Lacticaseibacillus paracasei]|uniref:hypothetical protein n=1 Tax=Lacticaseibacillus paracasei TaxID=1597 RepID=UPI0021A3C9A1|nr:hypothetical protein [Lacticaseibacillus paracasei]UWP76172.1 hypothetical protein KZR06_12085 [Lacticaseibacillus paracasei]
MKAPEIIELFEQTHDLKRTYRESNVPLKIVYMILNKAGVLDAQTRLRSGSDNTRKGAFGEVEFQRIFPDALNCNDTKGRNNPNYDFDYHGLLVDVKTGARRTRKSGGSEAWGIRTSIAKGYTKSHVFVAFLLEQGLPYKVNHILLIPQGVADGQTGLYFTEGNAVMREYEVTEDELKQQINELVEYAKAGWI